MGPSHPQACYGNFCFQEWLPEEFVERISQLDTQSPVTKINGKRHTPLWSHLFDGIGVSRVQVWGKLTYVIISIPDLQPAPQFESEPLVHTFSS